MTIKNKDNLEIENLMIKVGRIQLYIIGLIIIGFASMGKEFMDLWMGSNFRDSYYIALLLILPGLITLTQEIAYTTLFALNKIKYRAYASIIVVVISLPLSLLLSNYYGALGAAVSIFIGNVVGLIFYMNFVYSKVLNLNIIRFFKECHMKLIFPLLLVLIAGKLIQIGFPTNSFFLFVVKALIVVTVYAVLMWRISFNQYEKNLVANLFNKIKKRGKKYV